MTGRKGGLSSCNIMYPDLKGFYFMISMPMEVMADAISDSSERMRLKKFWYTDWFDYKSKNK